MKHQLPRSWPQTPTMLAGALACAALIVGRVIAGANVREAWREVRGADNDPGWTRVQDFAWSTLRDYGWGDAVLSGLSQCGVPRQLRPLLLVAVTEWRKGRVAQHALVHETVALAKALNPRWGGFANALLRRLDQERARWRPEAFPSEGEEGGQAHWRHPKWWIERVRRDFPNQWQEILALGNDHPPMGLRVRRVEERDRVLGELAKAGIAAEAVAQLPDAIWLPKAVAWQALPQTVRTHAVIQDIGAQWAAHWLNPQPGERILDACAAPGGKALHLLDREPTIKLTALDQSPERLAEMTQRFPELRQQAAIFAADATMTETWWDGRPFDAVLVDAPCSASGVVRRHPDIKWLRREADLAGFVKTQERLLESLWPLVKPGGRLLYATCSLFAEEDEGVVRRFLAAHPEGKWLREREGFAGPRVVPTRQNDGFFYALLVKGH